MVGTKAVNMDMFGMGNREVKVSVGACLAYVKIETSHSNMILRAVHMMNTLEGVTPTDVSNVEQENAIRAFKDAANETLAAATQSEHNQELEGQPLTASLRTLRQYATNCVTLHAIIEKAWIDKVEPVLTTYINNVRAAGQTWDDFGTPFRMIWKIWLRCPPFFPPLSPFFHLHGGLEWSYMMLEAF